MLVYEGIKSSFISEVNLNKIVDNIYDKYIQFFGKPNESQIRAWKNSMQYMENVLNDKEIPDNAGVAIEFNIPATSKKIDFILSGRDKNSKDSIIIIELKQWETCSAVEGKDGIVSAFTGKRIREVAHPSYQALSYANLIKDFNETIQLDEIGLHPCAFLHNYELKNDDPICSKQYQEYINEAPLFGSKDFERLRKFIKKYISEGDNKELLYKIEKGRIKPSKRLQDSLVKMLKGNKEFILIDEQKVIYEEAISMAIDTVARNSKNVLIVQGGPGTGKSVLAINLLVELTKRGMTSFYVTKNAAPRTVFRDRLKGEFKMTYINNLFQGSGQFTKAESNEIDVLIVDEAHRLNAKSGRFQNMGENQIKEIIKSSNFSIFFIDEDQRVTLKDIGSIDEIKKYAKELNAGISMVELESQFRCNGSDGYLAWLDNILNIKETANFDIEGFNYDFKVFDNPNEMREAIIGKNETNNKSRIVAGYCWNWPTGNTRKDTNYHEIKIPEYDFEISWNLDGGESFAIGKNSINEAGCIHTVQGLEFDYVGVIIGNDMRYEDGQIITDYTKRARTDSSLNGLKKIIKEQGQEVANKMADTIIKNTYRTLMTRGMKGCYIYCLDKNLQEYLKLMSSTSSK